MVTRSRDDQVHGFREPVREVKVIQVIEIVTGRGDGTEENLIRLVKQYFGMDGSFLAECDPAPAARSGG